MPRFIAQRVLRAALVLAVLTILVFALVRLVPGDPGAIIAGANSSPGTREAIDAQLGLDQPFMQQYFSWLGNVAHGSFGRSLLNGRTVASLVGQRLPVSLELAVMATFISLLWGIPAGIVAGVRNGKLLDRLLNSTSFFGLAVPNFLLGSLLVLLFSTQVPSWPTFSFVTFQEAPLDNLQVMLLPAVTLGLPLGATVCRYMRSSLIDINTRDFMRAATARGISPFRRIVVHGVRNAGIPVLTVVGLQMAFLVGGTVIVEQVFALPGLGSLVVQAVTEHDYPVVQACVLVLGAVYVLFNLAIDLCYLLIDPSVRHASITT